MSDPDRDLPRRWKIGLESDVYPTALASCHHPPEILYGMGDPTCLQAGLAIIGSRRATPYGRSCARRFAGWAAARGICVISGAATGCDIEAHRAALEVAGPTVAVLGCGPDVDYPPRERETLAELRARACVISEVPFRTRPTRWAFPRRNRIIAGLAHVVLVVEAALPSGTFSTADHALDAGREVAAVPGSIFAAGSAGTNRLIRQGAHVITCEEDLADALRATGLSPTSLTTASSTRGDRIEDALLRALLADPMTPERVSAALGLRISSALSRLGELEAEGLLARYPDGRYGPC